MAILKRFLLLLAVLHLSGCFGSILDLVEEDVRRVYAAPGISVTVGGAPVQSGAYTCDCGTTTADGDGGVFSASTIFTITNAGTADLAVSAVAMSDGAISDFDVTNSVPASLPPAAFGSFAVRFDPLATGSRTATLTITTDDPRTPAFTIAFSGVGSDIPVADIAVKNGPTPIPTATGSVSFGYETIGGGDTVVTLTIENAGSADLALSAVPAVQVVPTNVGFSVTGQPSSTIPPATTSNFDVTFSPSTSGVKTATITIQSNDPDCATYTFSVSGIGVAKLTASGGVADDTLGQSVALSGNVLIAGAPRSTGPGSACVYRWNGSSWIPEQTLTAADGSTGDFFGLSVGISGNYAVVGAPYDDVGSNSNQGSAYVYYYNGTSWSQQAQLLAADGAAGDTFGSAVSISGDNVLVGARGESTTPTTANGAAYVFARSGATWPQKTKLTASDKVSSDHYGDSVSISGAWAVVGAPDRDDGGSGSGAIYSYWYNGISWGAETRTTASDAASSDFFGGSVSAYQCFYVVGATGDDDKGSDSGSVYLYWQNPDSMAVVPMGKLTAPDGAAGDAFGRSVSRSSDFIVVGADLADGKAADSGKIYLYAWDPGLGAYACAAPAVMNDGGSSDWFGHSVAVDGGRMIGGSHYDDDRASNAGAVYVIDIP